MAAQFGVWSHEDDGFVVTQCWSQDEADRELENIKADPDATTYTLSVREVCPDHDEEPQDGCEECAAEETDEDED